MDSILKWPIASSPFYVKWVAIFGVLSILQGCATVGSPFQFQGPDSVVVGKTTQAEVLSKYGKPFRVGFENGSTKWTYGYYQYKAFGASNTKDVERAVK